MNFGTNIEKGSYDLTHLAADGELVSLATIGEHDEAVVQRQHQMLQFAPADPGDNAFRMSRPQSQFEFIRLLFPPPVKIQVVP